MLIAGLMLIAGFVAYVAWVVKHGARRGVYRYHLFRCRKFRVFLHHVDVADPDRDLHNHPWVNAWSLILWGGYREIVDFPRLEMHGTTDRWHFAGMANRLYPDAYHRIAAVLPNTWTLFIAGPRTRSWGFLTPLGHVDWRTYLGVPEGTDLED
jgi:hypothetical protein